MQEKQIGYPLKFYPVLKQTLWGGDKIVPFLSLENEKDKDGSSYAGLEHVGECWAVSAIEGYESVVCNGHLKGTSLPKLVEWFGGSLVGSKILENCGKRFPLLVKFIDAARDLSVQVHPNDELAMMRHNCSGKSEMWYVLGAENGARLVSGFNKPVTAQEYAQMSDNEVVNALKSYNIAPGDMFYLPAGTIHSIGKGALIAEIQQSSDITYRIYDYNRRDKNGNFRELHVEQAAQAIDFSVGNAGKIERIYVNGSSNNAWSHAMEVVSSKHFSSNIILLEGCCDAADNAVGKYREFEFNYGNLDSFVILTCVKGCCTLVYNKESMLLERGSVVLLPADLECVSIRLQESISCELLETHV